MKNRKWWGGSNMVPLSGPDAPPRSGGVPQDSKLRHSVQPQPKSIGNKTSWGMNTVGSTGGTDTAPTGGGFMTHAPRKASIWGLPTLYNTTAPDRPYTGGESRSDHFNDAASTAGNDPFAQTIRNRVQDQHNLTFSEPPGDD
jgi:hypothetical protein